MPPAEKIRLAHISDLHLLDLTGLRYHHLLSKRLIGLLNLLTGRRGAHSWEVAEQLIGDLLAQRPDHVVVTGDLSNLSLPSELHRAAGLLSRLGDRHRLSVLPGNHDRYTVEAGRMREFERVFAPWLVSDLAGAGVGDSPEQPYPWVKLLGPVALIGLCSARPSPWFFATGTIGTRQREQLEELLQRPELTRRMIVVCLHHPLLDRPATPLYRIRRLTDEEQLRQILLRSRTAVVLHGHNHGIQQEVLLRPADGAPPLLLLGATSASLVHGPAASCASYAIQTLDAGRGEVLASQWRHWDGEQGAWVGEEQGGAGERPAG